MGDFCSICSEIHLLKVHGQANQNYHFANCEVTSVFNTCCCHIQPLVISVAHIKPKSRKTCTMNFAFGKVSQLKKAKPLLYKAF